MNQDKSARYHARRRRASVAGGAWTILFLSGLLASGASGALRDLAVRSASRSPLPAFLLDTAVVAVYVLVVGLLHEVGALPIDFYRGFLLEHRYGLSTERLSRWIRDQLKGWLVGGVLSAGCLSALYAAIRLWPGAWWIVASLGFLVLVAGMVRLAPALLMPIFFHFQPLGREELRQRLVALSARAGVPVLDVMEWQLGDRTKKGNAALAGLGRTRRILVSDTLLASCSDDEIETVLAHELGHHVHRDIWWGIAAEGAVASVGFFLASWALGLAGPRLGLSGPADVAGLPLLLLVAGLLSLVLLPAANAVSRWMERHADRYALELTRNPDAFSSAMQRLGTQNLAEENPSSLTVWLFHSHPPTEDRIAAAREWRERDGGRPEAGGGRPDARSPTPDARSAAPPTSVPSRSVPPSWPGTRRRP